MRLLLALVVATAAAPLPSEVLNLRHWALDLPSRAPNSTEALRLYSPALARYESPSFFVSEASAVALVVPVDGAHTYGSTFPRVELREVKATASMPFVHRNWDPTNGTALHELSVTMDVASLPAKRPQTVVAQVKGSKACLMIEVQPSSTSGFQIVATNHFFPPKQQLLGVLDANYALGTVFSLKLQLHQGLAYVYYKDMATPALMTSFKDDVDCDCRNTTSNRPLCYFKTGNYLQTNSTFDAPAATGIVHLYQINSSHSNATEPPPQNASKIIKRDPSKSTGHRALLTCIWAFAVARLCW
ncbi:hypothetical protein ACHHYP_00241 [Achlya hypogyna]|uniref:Secreted protein n=1 Tax=Achlya hypogyna TaxID=1202772 RepID=A0A0A7CMN2_ACHHY|nr:secreted protein [Achlya hypogyna]OQR95174.1 hypothetical protein ACHHYP_00241 [Achlya hypogyna]